MWFLQVVKLFKNEQEYLSLDLVRFFETCLVLVSITLCSLVMAEMLETKAVSLILGSVHLMLILNSNSTARFFSSTSITSSMMNPKYTTAGNPKWLCGVILFKSKFCSAPWPSCWDFFCYSEYAMIWHFQSEKQYWFCVIELTSCHSFWVWWWDVSLQSLLPKASMAQKPRASWCQVRKVGAVGVESPMRPTTSRHLFPTATGVAGCTKQCICDA